MYNYFVYFFYSSHTYRAFCLFGFAVVFSILVFVILILVWLGVFRTRLKLS